MDPLATHSDWQALVATRDALLGQIAGILTDIHDLEDARPLVLARYAAAFATRLTTIHGLEIEAARLKREIELVQSALNARAEVDYDAIQRTLEREFAEWQAAIEHEAMKLAACGACTIGEMDPLLARRLRDIFRVLARRLHPDLHPGQPPEARALWHRVTAAYDNGDLDELSALEIITKMDTPSPVPDSRDGLDHQVVKLRAQFDALVVALATRRGSWPFDQLELLDDPVATAARQAELDDRIAAVTATRDQRKNWLAMLLDSPPP